MHTRSHKFKFVDGRKLRRDAGFTSIYVPRETGGAVKFEFFAISRSRRLSVYLPLASPLAGERMRTGRMGRCWWCVPNSVRGKRIRGRTTAIYYTPSYRPRTISTYLFIAGANTYIYRLRCSFLWWSLVVELRRFVPTNSSAVLFIRFRRRLFARGPHYGTGDLFGSPQTRRSPTENPHHSVSLSYTEQARSDLKIVISRRAGYLFVFAFAPERYPGLVYTRPFRCRKYLHKY